MPAIFCFEECGGGGELSICGRAMGASTFVQYEFLFQSRSPRWEHVGVLLPHVPLQLISDGTVSFDQGPFHGSWRTSSSGLNITFHHTGRQESAFEHIFVRIANTNTLAMTHAQGRVQTDAILILLTRPEPTASFACGTGSKRPRP